MTTITLDNRDTENVHIDTYHMLTSEHTDESEIAHLCEKYNNDQLTYDDFDWSYDHDAIVKAFAMASINYLHNELVTHGNGIVKAITYKSHGSPKFYNYTTDYYVAEYEVDTVKLHEYIAQNYDAVRVMVLGYSNTIINDFEVSKEDLAHAGLCRYINATIDREDYNMHLWDLQSDVYNQNTTVTPIKKHE